jgi:hypothetical protein
LQHLVKYNAIAQHYGSWLKGYDWKIYGCGTFRNRVNPTLATALGKRFFERLKRRLRKPVSYVGVVEKRYSGLGLPPIAAHWHFLASAKVAPAHMVRAAHTLWQDKFGNAKIEVYDPRDPNHDAVYYVAKLAGHENGDLIPGRLDLMDYCGLNDLLEEAANNPYVPDRLKTRVFGEYLVMRP